MSSCFLQTAFNSQKDFGKEAREAAWAAEQRTIHGLQSAETKMFSEKHNYRELNIMAEEAKKRAEVARYVCFISSFLHVSLIVRCNHVTTQLKD